MPNLQSGLVDILRDFLAVYGLGSEIAEHHAGGRLCFDDVRDWVGEDARSELFRLKERCHAMFRPEDDEIADMRVGALLDLAVGSLFHEAMKLRENLYQQERYRPRVVALRGESDPESLELFKEFEKLLSRSAASLEESVAEVGVLLDQTRKQLRRLLTATGATGVVARCLYENEARVVTVYEEGLDALLERIFGDAVTGYVMAGESYLESAYYAEALAAFAEALRRAPERGDVRRLSHYAEGMLAFFSRDYGRSVDRLCDWLDAGAPEDALRVKQALAGAQHIEKLPPGDEDEAVVSRAAALSGRLREISSTL